MLVVRRACLIVINSLSRSVFVRRFLRLNRFNCFTALVHRNAAFIDYNRFLIFIRFHSPYTLAVHIVFNFGRFLFSNRPWLLLLHYRRFNRFFFRFFRFFWFYRFNLFLRLFFRNFFFFRFFWFNGFNFLTLFFFRNVFFFHFLRFFRLNGFYIFFNRFGILYVLTVLIFLRLF